MKRYEIPGSVRFLTFSCERRQPLFRNAAICDVFVGCLAAARARHGFALFAWVIMPEHVHLLVRPGEGRPLERALRSVKMPVAKRVLKRWKELNAPILARIQREDGRPRFWQKGGGFDRNVRDESAFMREVRYIHRNPVERELVARPEDWKWSSVRWWMGKPEHELACDPPPGRGWERWRGFM